MNLLGMSAGWFALGLAALAALLYALQRLRVRHREVEVVTTLFWMQAVQETRARVFVQRFRHPWAYLLLLLIASLLWLATARPAFDGEGGREHVLVLDGSAGMASGQRLQTAVQQVAARAAELPRARTRILFAGGRIDVVLDRREPLAMFEQRLAGRPVEAVPPSLVRAVEMLLPTAGADGLDIELFAADPLDAARLPPLPPTVSVHQAPPPPSLQSNAGITALGVREARSGDWDKVDLRVEVAGSALPTFRLGGAPLLAPTPEVVPGGAGFTLLDLPARGQQLMVALPAGDALALDDRASLWLPDRKPLRVLLGADLPPTLRAALAADRGLELVEGGAADVAVCRAGSAAAADLPALQLSGDDAPAFVVRHEVVRDAAEQLRADFDQLGLQEVDATALAEAAQKPIELQIEASGRRGVDVWAVLFGNDFDFAATRAMPLFVAKALRYLAAVPPLPFQCAAGEVLRGVDTVQRASRTLDSLGAELRLPAAGDYQAGGRPLSASLLSPAVSMPSPGVALPAPSASGGGGDLWPWLVLLALLLLLLEWVLVRRERMP